MTAELGRVVELWAKVPMLDTEIPFEHLGFDSAEGCAVLPRVGTPQIAVRRPKPTTDSHVRY
jgi:hypothetical protein